MENLDVLNKWLKQASCDDRHDIDMCSRKVRYGLLILHIVDLWLFWSFVQSGGSIRMQLRYTSSVCTCVTGILLSIYFSFYYFSVLGTAESHIINRFILLLKFMKWLMESVYVFIFTFLLLSRGNWQFAIFLHVGCMKILIIALTELIWWQCSTMHVKQYHC